MSSLMCVLTRGPRTKAGILAQPFYFQAGPIENFGYETAVEFADYDTISRRRFSRPVSKQLTNYVLDTIFTNYLMEDVPHALYGYVANLLALGVEPGRLLDPISSHPFFSPPDVRIDQLRTIQDSLTPVILTMADSAVLRAPAAGSVGGSAGNDLSVEVTLRNVKQEERAGETDALYVQCTFVDFGVVQLKTVKRGGAKGHTATGDTKLTIRTLDAPRCTIARIAKWKYGDASKTAAIYGANKPWLKEFGKDENLRAIATGTVTQTDRMKRLKALLAKHPQIIIPPLKKAAATTRVQGQTFVGGQ